MKSNLNFRERMLAGGIWVTAGFVINAVSGLVIGILLTRLLSKDDVGTYFLLFSIATTLSVMAQVGLDKSVVRFISKYRFIDEHGTVRVLVIKTLRVIALIGLIILLVGGAIDYIVSVDTKNDAGEHQISFLFIAFWVLLLMLRQFLGEVFRGLGDIARAVLIQRVVPNVLYVVVLIGFLGAGLQFNYIDIVAVNAVIIFLVVLSALYLLFIRVSSFPSGTNLELVELFKASLPLFLSQFFQLAMMQASVWMLGSLSTSDEVALYGTAFRCALLVSMPLLIVNNIVMSTVAGMYSKGEIDRLKKLLNISVVVSGVCATLITAVFIIFGEPILRFLFGEGYAGGYMTLVILALGYLFNVYSGSGAVLMSMTGHEKQLLVSVMLAASVTFVAGGVLIGTYGSAGAAVALCLGLITYNIMLVIKCYKCMGIKTYLNKEAFHVAVNVMR